MSFGYYLDIYGGSKFQITISFLKYSPIYFRTSSLVKWNFSPHLFIGSAGWFLCIARHESCRSNACQRVRSWFYRPQWSTKGWFNILAYPPWWYHALCSTWETLPCSQAEGVLHLAHHRLNWRTRSRQSLRWNIQHKIPKDHRIKGWLLSNVADPIRCTINWPKEKRDKEGVQAFCFLLVVYATHPGGGGGEWALEGVI